LLFYWIALKCSFPPSSLSHTHTHTYTHTLSHILSHTLSLSQKYTHTHTLTHSHTPSHDFDEVTQHCTMNARICCLLFDESSHCNNNRSNNSNNTATKHTHKQSQKINNNKLPFFSKVVFFCNLIALSKVITFCS